MMMMKMMIVIAFTPSCFTRKTTLGLQNREYASNPSFFAGEYAETTIFWFGNGWDPPASLRQSSWNATEPPVLGSWGSYVGHGGDTYGFLSESGVLSEFNASFSATANEVQGGWWRCSFASWVGLKIRHNNNLKGKICFKSIGIDRQTQV
jgi:hypothetical protein